MRYAAGVMRRKADYRSVLIRAGALLKNTKTAFAKLGKRRKALKVTLLGLFHMSALAEPADSVLVDAHVYILAAVRFEFAAVGRKTE